MELDNGAMDGSVPAVAQQEKMIPQSVVNQIVAREKSQAVERARQQMMEQTQQQGQMQSQGYTPPQTNGMGGMPSVNVEQLKREIYEKVMAEAQEAEARRQEEQHKSAMMDVASQYHRKMGIGKENYQDFDDVIGDFNAAAFPKIVYLASQLDNTSDVMYELAKNPQKLAMIDYLADKSPAEAQKALKSIGSSIQQNRAAMQQSNTPSAPLSRMKPSTAVGNGGGPMSIADFKARYKG